MTSVYPVIPKRSEESHKSFPNPQRPAPTNKKSPAKKQGINLLLIRTFYT